MIKVKRYYPNFVSNQIEPEWIEVPDTKALLELSFIKNWDWDESELHIRNWPNFSRFTKAGGCIMAEYEDGSRYVCAIVENPEEVDLPVTEYV